MGQFILRLALKEYKMRFIQLLPIACLMFVGGSVARPEEAAASAEVAASAEEANNKNVATGEEADDKNVDVNINVIVNVNGEGSGSGSGEGPIINIHHHTMNLTQQE